MRKPYIGQDRKLKYLFENASEVSCNQIWNSGQKIATITIDGNLTEIYAPEQTDVNVQTIATQGIAIGVITVDGQDHILYSPVASKVKYSDLVGDNIVAEDGADVVYNQPTYQVGKLNINNGKEYELTEDTEVIPDKEYFELVSTEYNEVTPEEGDSPVLMGWYEYDDEEDEYFPSSDYVPVSGKTYYEREDTFEPVVPIGNENPHTEGWYERAGSVFPIRVPAAFGLSFTPHYPIGGINVGTFKARYIVQDPQHEDQAIVAHEDTFDIIVPAGGGSGSVVNYDQILDEGTLIGRITINGISTNIYAPEGGVSDVCVNGESVVDENHVAQIDSIQPSLKDDIDRIYNVCVGMGHTPPTHEFADVMLTAMFAIGGGNYRSAESTLNMGMRYFTKEV